MALVAPDVVRYTLNGTYLGRPTANVLDMVVQPDIGASRDDAIAEVANQIVNQFTTNVIGFLSNVYELDSISYVDLNSETGAVGERFSSDTTSLPQFGDQESEPYSAAIAALVTKVTTSARGQRSGRWFLPGMVEQYVFGNTIQAGFLASFQTGLGDFLEGVTSTGIADPTNYFPTVIHTRNTGTASAPVIVYVNNTQITDLQISGRVSTQRRRNRP